MCAKEKSSSSRPRLGRGLSSLISTSASPAQAAGADFVSAPLPSTGSAGPAVAPPVRVEHTPQEIATDQIAPNPYQPRREFNEEQLSELTESIIQQGILQPLIVAEVQGDFAQKPYVLIAGERRLRAAIRAGFKTVPCVIRKATPQQMLEWALIENIQRSDLNPIEKAHAYRQYMDRFSLTGADAAEKLGQPRTTIANYLRILELDDSVQQMLVDGQLSFGHAKVIAGLVGQGPRQQSLAAEVVAKSLSVRQLEELAAKPAAEIIGPNTDPSHHRRPPVRAAYLRDLEERLTAVAGTRVSILPGRTKNTGRVVVEYYSLDDFDRLTQCLGLKEDSV